MSEDLKARLLARRADTASGLPETHVDVPGMGRVYVRGLNRIEAMHVQEANGPEATERRILALGMVDPTLTEAEAGQWQKTSLAGEIEAVSRKIAELSGMLDSSAKAVVKTFRDGPDGGVRAVPGAEAGDDPGPVAAGDGG